MRPFFLPTFFLCVAALLCCAGRIFSQNGDWVVKVREVGVEDGLSSRFVNRIFQDSEDFMWFSTSEGLNRYDGYRMEVFHPQRIGGRVAFPFFIMEDCASKIWLSSQTVRPIGDRENRYVWTLDMLDPISRKIIPADSLLPFPLEDLTQVGSIPGKLILFGTRHGAVFAYDGSVFPLFGAQEWGAITHLGGWGDGTVYFVSGKVLRVIDQSGKLLYRADLPKRLLELNSNDKGDLWGLFLGEGGEKSLIRLFSESEQTLEVPLSPIFDNHDPDLFRWLVTPDGGLVLGYYGTLLLLDSQGNLILDFPKKLHNSSEFLRLTFLYFDHSGGLWLNNHSGVAKLTWNPSPFRNFLHEESYSIRGLGWSNDSVLLVANYSGALLLNIRSGRQIPLPFKEAYGLGVSRDKEGFWWLGVHSKQFLRISADFKTLDIIPLHIPEKWGSEQSQIDCKAPFTDSRGKIWLGTSNGLGYYDPGFGKALFLHPGPRFSDLQEKSVNCFLEDEKGLWVGTSGGLYLLGPDGEVRSCVDALRHLSIYFIHRDREGSYWLATRGDGLVHWDPESGLVEEFNTETGLISNVIYAILEDEKGYYWLSSNNGLIRFDPRRKEFLFFRGDDGMAGEEFNFMAFAKGKDGRFYFGGIDGITSFHPDSVQITESLGVPIRITSYSEWEPESGKMVTRTPELLEKGRIELLPPMHSFHLSFALMSYHQPGNLQYAYWLEGLERGWTLLSEPVLRLSRIPHGKYTLHIKGRGENGQWSTRELRIPVVVKRPFYQYPWFWLLILLCMLGVGFFYYRIYVWQLKRRQVQLEKEVERRTRDLRNSREIIGEQYRELEKVNRTKDHLFLILAHELKNPVLSFRNLSKKISYLLHKQQFDRLMLLGAKLDQTASNAHNLLDNLLQWAKTQRGTFFIHPRQIDLWEAFSQVMGMYQEKAKEKGIALVSGEEWREVYVWADPAALQVVLRNLVDNAVKFTASGGRIWLEAYHEQDITVIKVIDSGIGMKPEILEHLFQTNEWPGIGTAGERGSGLGLLLVKELMDLHKGQVKAFSSVDKGTIFELQFPRSTLPKT